MREKKTVCFVSHNENTTEYIYKQLVYYLGDYINVEVWPLQYGNNPISERKCDIYVTSSYSVWERISGTLFGKKVIIADRALNIENIDKVFELPEGTKALMVGNTCDTATRGIKLINKVGIKYLDLVAYYPGCNMDIPSDINTALTTGSPHLVPENITKIVDLGVVGLDLSTYVELILSLKLPKELINNISQYYIREIYDLSLRTQKVAQTNIDLKRRYEVIIDTVNEAIVAIDNNEEIILVNRAAENLLGINSILNIGKKLQELFPQLDLKLVTKSGLPITHEIKQVNDNSFVINANPIIGHNSILEGAVIAFQPVGEVQKIENKVRRELKKKNNIAKHFFEHIVGRSKVLTQTIRLAREFSNTDLTVLIEGESGTGKELFSQAIHNDSKRATGPFVAINFAALPENLVDSELFGYEEGAFTGAKKGGKLGLFEEAHNGTIFLDEIGDASLDIQKKLLRVLEEREVRKVGGSTVTPINVRVIAATNQNLMKMVEEGKFRSDLFYRLCAIPIKVPPLRDRKEDIFDLINYFSQRFYKTKLIMDNNLQKFLLNYHWPGNIRELENVTKYMCSIAPKTGKTSMEHLPVYLFESKNVIHNISTKLITTDSWDVQEKIRVIIKELREQGALYIYKKILEEIKISSTFEKGMGRNYLKKRLAAYGEDYTDHKLKQILNVLKKLGLIEQGKTKQGSKISSLGIKLLENMD